MMGWLWPGRDAGDYSFDPRPLATWAAGLAGLGLGLVLAGCTSAIGSAGPDLDVPVTACDARCHAEAEPITTTREGVHETVMDGEGACDGCGWCEHAQGAGDECAEYEDSREQSRFVRADPTLGRKVSRRCYLCTGSRCRVLDVPCDGRFAASPSGSYEVMCTYDVDEYDAACPARDSR